MRSIITIITGMAVSLAVAAPSFAQTPELDWANRLIDDLPVPSALNAYGSPTAVAWAGVGGATVTSNRSTCAPFVTRVVKRARGWSDTQLKSWFGSTSPSSEQYHAAITGGAGPFTARQTVGAVAPGDVIAVRYDGDESVTGHTMIAASAPKQITAASPHVAGTTQWTLEVADSTSTPHGDGDTRRYEDASGATQSQPGAGRGTLRLYAGADGRITGHTWSPKSSAYRANVAGERPIAIAGVSPLAVGLL